VFFTEGSTDPIIIREAWHQVYASELPFIPFYAFSCSYLSQLLRDDRITREMGDKTVFGLFDLDRAFDEWNGLKGDIVCSDLLRGKCKKMQGKNAYAFLLPVPTNPDIRKQVIRNKNTGESFGGDSLCEIEHLFYGDPLTAEFFTTEPTPGGGTKIVIKSDAQKERFAREVIPKLGGAYFDVFRPMFELVKKAIANEAVAE